MLRRFPIQVLSSFCIHFPHLSSVCVIHVHLVCCVYMSLCWTGVLELHSHTLLVSRHACDVIHLLFQAQPLAISLWSL